MMRQKITIKFWLYATATGIIIILLFIGLLTNKYVNKAFEYNKLSKSITEISHQFLNLRKTEKDFIHRETINPTYFETRESKYLDEYRSILLTVRKTLQLLENNKLVKQLNVLQNINSIDNLFSKYYLSFYSLEDAIYKKGFKDYGLIGEMRENIHFVEDLTIERKGNPQVNVHMLMLRRHEKDYLLRKDLRYKEKFNDRITQFTSYLKRSNDIKKLSPKDKKVLIKALKEYQDVFHKVIEKDVEIGLDDKKGITKKMNSSMDHILEQTEQLRSIVDQYAHQKINEAITMIVIISFILSLSIILLILRLSRHIVKSIRFLHKYITRLGRGELPERIEARQEDEISEMVESINVLTENLKNTKDFAIEVGKGNLDTKIHVFDNKGDLGGSLIEMRNKLAQVNKERNKTEVEAQRRVWITEGIAEFAIILRKNHDKLEEFAEDIISFILNYTDSIQGAIYFINDEDKDDVHYEMKAAIAYGEDKIVKKRLTSGEDILSRSIAEKKLIHIKDAPEFEQKVQTAMEVFPVSNIISVPLMLLEDVIGVIELGRIKKFKEHHIEFLERICKDITATVANLKTGLKQTYLLKQTQEQAKKLIERQEEIEQQKTQLEKTAKTLHELNEQLSFEKEYTSSSIRYAKTIQHSILPGPRKYKEIFQEHFILYRPKDIVSGDFYWIQNQVNRKLPGKIYTAVVDCTGHGVPGAFMSLIGSRLLNELVNVAKIQDPAEILEQLHQQVVTLLNQEGKDMSATMQANNDGMDLALLAIEPLKDGKRKVIYSGAKIPLYFSIQGTSQLQIVKPDRRSIGGVRKRSTPLPFKNHELLLDEGDILFLSTDGIIDQHSPDKKKFSSKQLMQLLEANATLPLGQQKKHIEEALDNHQQGELQRDDITVVGIKL